MGEDSSAPPKGGADARVAFLRDRVIASLKVKDDQWNSLMISEAKLEVLKFCDDEDTCRLLVWFDGKELRAASSKPPGEFKRKVVYFLKREPGRLASDTIRKMVHVGDFQKDALENLSNVAQNIFLPLLTSNRNHRGWSEVVTQEVVDNMHKLLANVNVTLGHIKGQTILPLPPDDTKEPGAVSDKEKIHILESAIVTWTRQIKGVIKADPDAPLKIPGNYPGPLVELDFWTERAANLNSIHDQLSSPKIVKVVEVLRLAESTYYPAFQRLFKDVAAAQKEANDNVKFLSPLRPLLEKLNMMDEFQDLVNLFKPMMHLILLVWKHSGYYNQTGRVVTLIREICNDLIMQARKFLPGDELKDMDAQDAVDKLKLLLKILGSFKSFYFGYKSRSMTETPDNPWRFQNSALFSRLDSFLERCHNMMDLQSTCLQFSKLERVEMGGTKGEMLTREVKSIHTDFLAAVQAFQELEYDVMDVDAPAFDADFFKFRQVIKELERRLGAIISTGFDECTTIGTTFKLLDAFEGLLDREVIAADLERKHMDLLQSYRADLEEVSDIFQGFKERPVRSKNAAPCSGAVAWVRGLIQRVEDPMLRIRNINKMVLETEEFKEIQKLYDSLMTSMAEYETKVVSEWKEIVKATSDAKLNQPLLALLENDGGHELLRVNFDPDLVKLLRETKYFLLLNIEVPESTMKVYDNSDTFRQQISSLDLIVSIWNKIQTTILEVERPLISMKLEECHTQLHRGLQELNWNSPQIDGYIQQVMEMVKEMDDILMIIKDNVQKTIQILATWEKELMFERKDAWTYSFQEINQQFQSHIEERHKKISDNGKEIAKLLSQSNRALSISKAVPAWKDYVDYVSLIVINGLSRGIIATVEFVRSQIDPDNLAKHDVPPLLQVQLELEVPEVKWKPDLQEGTSEGMGVRGMFNGWLKSFASIGTLLRRLDIGEGDYSKELEEDYEVMDNMSRVNYIVLENEAKCIQFQEKFQKYDYLWKNDLQATLKEWLDVQAVESEDGEKDDPPLQKFEEEILKYKAIEGEIGHLPVSANIGWVKVDAKPVKKALVTWASRWVYLYTKYLEEKVVNSMTDLYAFMKESSDILDIKVGNEAPLGEEDEPEPEPEPEPEEGESQEEFEARIAEERRQRLYNVMACSRDIRAREKRTDNMFEPLKQTVALLERCSISIDDKVIHQLDQAPEEWKSLSKKKAMSKREVLSAAISAEQIEVRRRSDKFAEKVNNFRRHFQTAAPFSVDGALSLDHVAQAYITLDTFQSGEAYHCDDGRHDNVQTIIAESKEMKTLQDLFGVYVSDYLPLQRCSEELCYLKGLWDVVACVMFTFNDWYLTPWDKIDVEFLVDETKKLTKDVKTLNKAVRNYRVFQLLEEALKAMLTSLPLVQELHDPAMRDRHWKQLMQATQKEFVMDENFNLGALLELGLHNNVETCQEIVERARKELGIEKSLNKIDDTWSKMDLAFTPYPDSEVYQMSVDDMVQEALEADNLALQGLSSGKWVQGNPKFLELVTNWQRKLGIVDSVLQSWQDVQKKWQNLESIFVGSADIRVQLPEDSKRFDVINADFQDLMRNAPDVTNVVEACNMEGRQERLDNMLAQLEMCEKALQDYLETKRIAFPRFYFVAPADLLDILSKGSNPQAVLRHLPKCFDNIHNLEFRKNDKGEFTKAACAMFSGENERVGWPTDCMCDGPVENWLNSVVDAMRNALDYEFSLILPTYEQMPRTEWIYQNSCQMTIVVTRLFFTSEVNEAFYELEDGNEDALRLEWAKQKDQLSALIDEINKEQTKLDRKMLIMLCTIDVHARDVVQRLIDEKVEDVMCFQWQSQLRYLKNEKSGKCQVSICDADIIYNNEYIGVPGCLCITPLTDRCYITLTQAQRLILGGAPAGPAGTGKTETTKDLARHLGVQCYVFNCSDQMDYKAMGQIYKGLAQTGAWGCFDEFNRIPVAVLSVCSTQYKTVLDAIRRNSERFLFEDVEISLKKTVMAFITMNPGYPGRAELPESLKALFRPVSMVVPDLALICEIMLMAEGFQDSKLLSRKFVILYKLCEDLLSKSRHYDWKLRAIKTTLYVAGSMKRGAPDLTEDKVLLRALRDFNLGKLTADDTSIFMGLLNDLFPKTLDLVPRAVDKVFEDQTRLSARKLKLQPDDMFCLKISQLREIFVVRWSVFLLGPAGCGKTAIWKTLREAQIALGEKTVFKPVNPKAVTRNELYGNLHPATREWKEGLMSVTFRDMANNKTNPHQWIVLDGDIDAEWIESMNTVMDDNKMLTLASNERIPLTASMRLLLEINHMNHCSPATVSRGGVIFVNAEDIGWKPVVDSWIEKLEDIPEYQPLLTTLFSRYVDSALEYCRRNFKYVVQLPAVSQVQVICKILEGILPSETPRGTPPPDRKLLEYHFVFACIWAFGGCMLVDKVSDFRTQFSKWWVSEWKNVQFPEKGLVYDYFVDDEQVLMVPWAEKVKPFTYSPDDEFGNVFVNTVETTRMMYFLDSLIGNKHYVMFVGNTGTGKTAMMVNKLKFNMDPETMSYYSISMNSFSDAPSLQIILEQPLEKKSGSRFGPPGGKRMVYFIDDMNMPFVDKYDTQSAIEIVRQYVDYNGWYDKVKIVLKEITNCQLSACMNPTAGSFHITPRMQRHFTTFAVQMPTTDIVKRVYGQIIEGHLSTFDCDVQKGAPKLVEALIELHKHIMDNFLPSAVKFHYQFNLRELSNITQGLLRMTKQYFKEPLKVARLFIHESERVFRDRMVSDDDMEKFDGFRTAVTKKYFDDVPQSELEERPNLFCSFMTFDAEDNPIYNTVPDFDILRKTLDEKLAEYNESNTVMNLVLFQQAMEHITRITRIISVPRGNAMLVGVGGSGKQSLARLSSFICGYDVFQISVSSSYGVNDFKENLLQLYQKAGAKGQPVTFLMTDNQIVNERFLVYINDLLATGVIPDLFSQEDKDNFSNAVRKEVKEAGLMESPDVLWDFFINKVRKFLHVVLCFSPVGDKFRVRARQFPALVSCTVFNWFHGWPHEALVSVAHRFLGEITDISDELRDQISLHMAFAHQAVSDAAAAFFESFRRHAYTTPKSYLELISLYKGLLEKKRDQLKAAKERLESGVDKIAQAAAQVADLQVSLKEEMIIVEEKKAQTDKLIEEIGKEKAVVDEAVEAGREDEEAATALQEEVQAFQAECEKDLEAAEPIIAEAEAALNSLEKSALGELKSFGSPAMEVVQVVSSCMVLTSPGGKIPKDLSWNAGKKFMGNVDAFLKSLINFDKDNIPEVCVDKCEKDFISNPNFNPDFIRNKSGAAAGLCAWVVNICKYFRIYQVVAPKRAALAEANKKLDGANKKLSGIRAKVKELQDRVAALEENLMKATEDKNNAIAQAEKTSTKAKLAERLINGLSGENKRWTETIGTMEVAQGALTGDVLLASAFVSYVAPFNMMFREQLVMEKWTPDLIERGIPMTNGVKPMDLLTTDTQCAKWANEGLPTDPLSVENGAIITSAARWSLMIDPQLQGIRWIVNREEPNGLVIIQQSQAKYIDKVKQCIESGLPILIENLPDDIDAVLDPVVGKQTIRRGRNVIMKIGDDEVDYDPNFRLYMQTKLSNPHYKPEIHAQTTLVNFCVTEKGLEDQLLAQVVEHERPDLQEQSSQLVKALGEYTITLRELEDNLLYRLANSQGDILEDIELIEGLEETKRTATEIEEKVKEAQATGVSISEAREVYRPVASRGSLVYFLVDNLNTLDRVYHYSMANFVAIMKRGMAETPGGTNNPEVGDNGEPEPPLPLSERVPKLVSCVTYTVFAYIAQGLFERHKLIVATQMCMAILKQKGSLQVEKFNYLLRGPKALGVENPLSEWVTDSAWASVQALKELDEYSGLPEDLIGSAKRWREWMELERPEDEPLPGDWKRMPELEQLLLYRALRPDRLTAAMSQFVKVMIGAEYVTSQPYDLERSFGDSGPGIPIFVFLSPGVDVAGSVEALGRKLGFTPDNNKYSSVSLGQGQEPIAMERLTRAHKDGGWVLLQNIHLTIDWTSGPLEKKVDKLTEGAHSDFRLFLSAEPPPGLERPLPISLLQNSIKLTNEPPEGLQANLGRAYGQFNEEMLELCPKQSEFRTIVFALCYFHAAIIERKKFGVGNMPKATSGLGWNMNYPFNTGDLLCCGQCANNYLENNVKVPWEDLRYIFGEIMYGGHIVEDWDRRLSNGYLLRYFNEQLLEGMEFFPGFSTPPSTANHKTVMEYIRETMPPETPLAFGLHPNAEIGFKLREAETFCSSLLLLQPREAGGDGGQTVEERAKMVLDELQDRLPEKFDMEDIRSRVDDFSPYVMVAIQESERMNFLLAEIAGSLILLDLGLKGDLTMTGPMEALMMALADDAVPGNWSNLAYHSLRPLGSWMQNLLQRVGQLQDWTAELGVPKVVWLSGLFNPQSFLTAVMQTTARRNDWPLDKTVILTEVTKKYPDQIDAPNREGAFIHGLTLEGARWDDKAGTLDDSRPKELFCNMPVILVKAVTVDKAEQKDSYQCPVYVTEARFRQEVFTAQLKTKQSPLKWILAGVCMFLDVV